MSSSQLVKQALSAALKEKMKQKPIQKIHVQELTDACHLTRHTFYNHFHDIYELLEWTYNQEIVVGLEKNSTLAHWPDALRALLDYTWDNQDICLNTFRSVGRDILERFIYEQFYSYVGHVVDEAVLVLSRRGGLSHDAVRSVGTAGASFQIEESDVEMCKDFYANALMGIFISWMKTGLKETPEQMQKRLVRVLDGQISWTLQHLSSSCSLPTEKPVWPVVNVQFGG